MSERPPSGNDDPPGRAADPDFLRSARLGRLRMAATLIARGEDGERPAWLRKTEGEPRWQVGVALLAAIALQLSVPGRYALHPQWVAPVVEAVILIGMAIRNPDRISRRSPALRSTSIFLMFVNAVVALISLGLLVRDLTSGHEVKPVTLLAGGAEIWLTIVIVFSLIYWEYDRGGPADRANAISQTPDLLFPQMTDETLAKNWEPFYFDYLFVSFTNSTAFSPTDTMPLSRWCKALFMLQSAMSLVTVGLVFARAVNILP